jgi:RNA polymerase sigma-70 factor (ECF subfamily)
MEAGYVFRVAADFQAFSELFAEAARAHPRIALRPERFAAHVAEKLVAVGHTDPRALRTTDLFLARAAADRDPQAILVLEHETFGEVEAAYRRFQNLAFTLDDLKQRLREKLILVDPPGVLAFAGTGALRGWVRAAALHMLLNASQRETREQPTDDELMDDVIGADPGAESAYLKLACRAEFEEAFGAALASLADRDRGLLRHAYVDGRNVDEIGAVYGVHRATAARWIASARTELVDRTRANLIRRLAISDAEARSIIANALSGVGSMLISKLGSARTVR